MATRFSPWVYRLVIFSAFLTLDRFSLAQAPPSFSFAARIDSPLAVAPNCLATGDFNGDHKLDVAACDADNNTVQVSLGNGDGTFQASVSYGAGTSPQQIFLGDFDANGKLDLLVVNNDFTVSVLLGNGDGTFQAQVLTNTNANVLRVVVVGDFNGDGKTDLAVPVAVPQLGRSAVAILLSNGDGTFQTPLVSSNSVATPAQMLVADFNADSKLDVLCSDGLNASVFLGNGDGSLQAPSNTALSPAGIAGIMVGDFNRDGIADLAVAISASTSTTGIAVLLGNGNGTFQTPTFSLNGSSLSGPIAVGDFNLDGNPDLLVIGSSPEVVLGNGDGTFQAPLAVGLPTGSGPTIVGDFNGDGKLDVASGGFSLPAGGQSNTVGVVLGKGNGTFASETIVDANDCLGVLNNIDVVVGDVNGDGKPDVVFGKSLEGSVCATVNLGNADGTLQASQAISVQIWAMMPFNLATGDFNHDGKLDLAITNGGVGILFGKGDGTFPSEVDYGSGNGKAVFAATADLNGDGNMDIVTADSSSNTVSVLLNNGDGTFGFANSYPVAAAATSLAVADFNNDGSSDVAVAIGNSVALLLGKADGTLGTAVQYNVGLGGSNVAVGDFNHDGNMDLVVSNSSSNYISVLLGKGDGTFLAPVNLTVGSAPTYLAVSDFNGDGHADIAVMNTGSGDVAVLAGNGDGTFHQPQYFGSVSVDTTTSMKAADLNGDGAPDIVISGTSVLFNRPAGARAILSANALNFGSQNTETTSAPQIITIRNTSRDYLTLSAVAITGSGAGDFSQTNTCGSRVPAGSTCSISITFTPTAGSSRNATLTLTDNAADSPQAVTLSGTGVLSTLGLGVAAGASASVTVQAGANANYTLAIGGTGFSGTATLTCSVPTALVCSLPANITVAAGSSTTFGVTVSTTSRSSLVVLQPGIAPWYWAATVLSLFFFVRMGRRTLRIPALAGVLPLIVLAACLCSCGGTSNRSNSGTPPGNYTVSVTAQSGSVSQSTSLTLIVQ